MAVYLSKMAATMVGPISHEKGYLCSSWKSPVPTVIGIPMMMHSLTPIRQTKGK